MKRGGLETFGLKGSSPIISIFVLNGRGYGDFLLRKISCSCSIISRWKAQVSKAGSPRNAGRWLAAGDQLLRVGQPSVCVKASLPSANPHLFFYARTDLSLIASAFS